MAATEASPRAWSERWQRTLRACAALKGRRARAAAPLGLIGGVLAGGAAHGVTLPEDKAEAMYHVYDGGGVRATGPALLVRKSLADKVSLSASYYVDMVSNASIDVVTTASPFKEKRTAYSLGADYVYRDSQISLSFYNSKEPDYTADAIGMDVSQEVFGGMTTVSLGFTRASDKVERKNDASFQDYARHWQYRVGVTQILTPRWLASVNLEAVSDDGYLGSPYRVARVFGAAVPERNPRTRSSRAVKFHVIGDLGSRDALRGEYRYFWDNWDIAAHTAEAGYSRYFGDAWLGDVLLRYYTQDKALFYSDNAQADTVYVSRNRQLSSFNSVAIGAKATYTVPNVPAKYGVKVTGAYEFKRFKFSDFTDIRTGQPYSFDAHVLQVYVSATY
ncbi:DUF3570 domain-containing protein [uncultured Methylibium sp.]|uniref:DUF3570 domain-containing protein n=1 Tax=uncultured Methylibium sp. TaxID=381093 RepID=UPI0025F4EBF6|nr:DUF3570 domain-containing protein [uncultured Methylibium sp.]